MDEILFVDKPKDITSFDVVHALRRKFNIKKIGHAGTLDPAATGLLVVGIGAGTKKLEEFVHLPKTYLMDVLFGRKTATGDLEGEVISEIEVSKIDEKKLKKILKSMIGEIVLPVPLYSAVKIGGVPLYKYARAGVKVTPPKKKTKIFYLRLLKTVRKVIEGKNFVVAKIEMKCEKGTYARAVAVEIGRKLGLAATLSDLRRTKIGEIKVENSKKIEEI